MATQNTGSGNVLVGGAGNDILHLEGSSNIAYGQSGSDTFVIHDSVEHNGGIQFQQGGISVRFEDMIYDFDLNEDVIDLSQFKYINSLNDISSSNWVLNGQTFAVVSIDFEPHPIFDILVPSQKMTLVNVDTNTLTEDNFIFYKNHLPEGASDTFVTDEDNPLAFTIAGILANDTDVEDGTPDFSKIVTGPSNGELVDMGAGSFQYNPDENYNGTDSFVYEIIDSHGSTTTSLVTLTINSVNDAPIADDDAYSGDEDGQISGNVLSNDTDVDGDVMTVQAGTFTTDQGGSVDIGEDGSFIYTPLDNFNSDDSFRYTLLDSQGGSSLGTLTLTVSSINDAPEGTDKTVSMFEDSLYTFSAADFGFTDSNDTSANALLNIIITTLPANGALALAGVAVTAGQSIAAVDILNLTYSVANDHGAAMQILP